MTTKTRQEIREQLEAKVAELRPLLSEGEQLDLQIFPDGWYAEVVSAQGNTLVAVGS